MSYDDTLREAKIEVEAEKVYTFQVGMKLVGDSKY